MSQSSGQKRVFITGMGFVTPLGLTIEENWAALMAGKSGIEKITRFDASHLSTHIAGEVRNFDPAQYMDHKEVRHYDRYIHFAFAAADKALADSGMTAEQLPHDHTGVLVGSGMGGMETFVENTRQLIEKGARRVSPFFVPAVISNMASGLLAIRYGARGPNYAIVSACATGAHSIGAGLDMIRRDIAEVMIVGGAEAAIIELGVAGFIASKALSKRNEPPGEASRPFDRDRDGFVIGEGAGVLIIESEEHAQRRGARIWAELLGTGSSSDAYHPTAPRPDGAGAALAMKNALAEARLQKEEIGYINAHATSTPLGDHAEAAAIRSFFKEHVKDVAVSSTKSMTGHLLGAAGAVETAYTVLALHHQILPPTINLHNVDPECQLNHVALTPRKASLRYALSNAFGFGGTNSAVVLGKYEG
jgi:3-oxoacyl-[acyl-carrier-protein] synthase II